MRRETVPRREFLTLGLALSVGTGGCLDFQRAGNGTTGTTSSPDGTRSSRATAGTPETRIEYTLEPAWSRDVEIRRLFETDDDFFGVGEDLAALVGRANGEITWERPAESDEFFLARERVAFAEAESSLIVPAVTGDGGAVYALDREDGSITWRHEVPHRDVTICGVHAEYGVIVGSRPRRGDQSQGRLLGLDGETGEVRWERSFPDEIHDVAILGGRLVIATSRSIQAVTIGETDSPREVSDDGAFAITPFDDGLLVIDSESIQVLDAGSLESRTSIQDLPRLYPLATIAGGLVIVGTTTGSVLAIDVQDGTTLWEVETDRKITAHTSGPNLVWMINQGGRILGLDPATGGIRAEEHIVDLFDVGSSVNPGAVGGWFIDAGRLTIGQFDRVRTYDITRGT